MCVGPIPIGKNQIGANGLREGAEIREYDELRAGMLTLEKISRHWLMPTSEQPWLDDIDWAHNVLCGHHMIIDNKHGLQLIEGAKEIPDTETVCYFMACKTLAEVLSTSKLNLQWFTDVPRAILRFDNIGMGGVVLCWDASQGGKELLDTTFGKEKIRFIREKNILTKDEKVSIKVAHIPALPTENTPAPKPEKKHAVIPPKEAEKAEVKAEKHVVKEVIEEPELPVIPEKPAEPAAEKPKKPFEGMDLEELLEALEDSIGKVKEAIHPMVGLLKAISKATKNSAPNSELKTLRTEVKELQSQNKQLERELEKKTKALKLLVSGDKF